MCSDDNNFPAADPDSAEFRSVIGTTWAPSPCIGIREVRGKGRTDCGSVTPSFVWRAASKREIGRRNGVPRCVLYSVVDLGAASERGKRERFDRLEAAQREVINIRLEVDGLCRPHATHKWLLRMVLDYSGLVMWFPYCGKFICTYL